MRYAIPKTTLLFVLMTGASIVDAALTTPTCLAQKRKAWGDLRKCEAGEQANALRGKKFDAESCRTKLAAKLAKIDAKADKAAITCRFRDNSDGTVTDYDKGLQWERKVGAAGFGGLCPPSNIHCVNDTYDWNGAQLFVS